MLFHSLVSLDILTHQLSESIFFLGLKAQPNRITKFRQSFWPEADHNPCRVICDKMWVWAQLLDLLRQMPVAKWKPVLLCRIQGLSRRLQAGSHVNFSPNHWPDEHGTCGLAFEAICFLVLHRASFVESALGPREIGIDTADSHF